jgi:hypothetical protein
MVRSLGVPMKLAALALLCLLAVSAAGAQPLPAGSGLLVVEERLVVASDCEPYRRVGFVTFSVFPNGTFRLQNDAGIFAGFLLPTDAKGRSWKLLFDAPSLRFYRLYLEAGVRAMCGRHAPFEQGGVESFVLRLGKDRSEVSLRLNASAGSSALGKARARHLIRGKGRLGPLLVPTESGIDGPRRSGATITMISPGQVE